VEYYNYNVELPFSKIKIIFREINTQEQLLISKANLTFSNDKDSVYEYHKYILDVILNCVKNKEDFLKIDIIEYVLFLVKLRTISIGSTIDFILKDEDKKNKTKIQIDLKNYMLNLFKASDYFEDIKNSQFIEKELEVKISWPCLTSIKNFNNFFGKEPQQYKFFNDSLFEFLEYIKIKNDKIFLKFLKKEEKLKLFEKLPVILKNKIENSVILAIKRLTNYDLFNISVFKDYRFSIYNFNFVEHVKLIFSYDLKSLFREIYYLASNNIDPRYVMSISDSERKMYLTIIQEETKRQEDAIKGNASSDIDNIGFSQAVKDLAVEFGQDLSK
jgi:hypothetical protein